MENLSNKRWKELILQSDNYVILDVRTPEECNEGIIDKAIQINFLASHDFVKALDNLDKEKKYFVYCRSGSRSAQACKYMSMNGFKTYNLENGIMGWDGEVVSI